jgi:hypothetical protein
MASMGSIRVSSFRSKDLVILFASSSLKPAASSIDGTSTPFCSSTCCISTLPTWLAEEEWTIFGCVRQSVGFVLLDQSVGFMNDCAP